MVRKFRIEWDGGGETVYAPSPSEAIRIWCEYQDLKSLPAGVSIREIDRAAVAS